MFAVGRTVHLTPAGEAAFSESCHGVSWKVEKQPVGPRGVNYTLVPIGGGRRARVRPEYLAAGPHPSSSKSTPAGKQAAGKVDVLELAPLPRELRRGTAVDYSHRESPTGVWVVTDLSYRGRGLTYTIHPFGGEGEGYTRIAPAFLTVVPVAEVANRLRQKVAV